MEICQRLQHNGSGVSSRFGVRGGRGRASDFGRFNTDEDNTKKPLALSLG